MEFEYLRNGVLVISRHVDIIFVRLSPIRLNVSRLLAVDIERNFSKIARECKYFEILLKLFTLLCSYGRTDSEIFEKAPSAPVRFLNVYYFYVLSRMKWGKIFSFWTITK